MFSYFYKLTPFFIVGTICILSLPWLGLIALFVVSAVVLLAVVWLAVYLPYRVVQAIRDSVSYQPAPARLAEGANR